MADDDTAGGRQRQILQQVAAGEVTPEDAAELLARVEAEGAGTAVEAEVPAAPPRSADEPVSQSGGEASGAPAPRADDDPQVAVIRVRTNCRALSIVGDPEVRTAVAEGEHTARLDGTTLTIESSLDSRSGFAFVRSPGFRTRAMVKVGADQIRPLVVRMNPDLALDSQMDAGSMTIRGVHGPIKAHTSAGAMRIDDFDSPIEIKVAAGSATARGRLVDGESRVECDAGKVSIRLSSDSSVKVRGRVNLGQLNAPDSVGGGIGSLDIVANLGAVEVAVDEDDE